MKLTTPQNEMKCPWGDEKCEVWFWIIFTNNFELILKWTLHFHVLSIDQEHESHVRFFLNFSFFVQFKQKNNFCSQKKLIFYIVTTCIVLSVLVFMLVTKTKSKTKNDGWISLIIQIPRGILVNTQSTNKVPVLTQPVIPMVNSETEETNSWEMITTQDITTSTNSKFYVSLWLP